MAVALAEIAKVADFTLFERTDLPPSEWRNLKLVKSGKAPKRNWWLAWNGERLARNRDGGILAEYDPEIETWVVETMTKLSEAQNG